ncbi:glycosyltransferase BC10-like [Dioscorea cayenensis subsp. rotundata]|uniref:Glycosyltransferase BC10-like n=1 Tax=Dioscorea cayennensis subsp. rotundata TaxID=55577 RepID=A0AB40ATZ6_DIOCR|nr:glycosyltransferase BC10-like [Dioscorea cayenensis subsp. rotundata]XP_039118461.1 glycosyltransferase BC10-like [Dioscorea cayenensis subsp. rotundata]XP_039118462.1 glycosyltransferase BC10-like [Dioscorea cayenensis subsp. rotundata]
MIEAKRILLRNALKDPFNVRFAFVSDSCIPLYNFSYIYDYIMSTSTSYLDRYLMLLVLNKRCVGIIILMNQVIKQIQMHQVMQFRR